MTPGESDSKVKIALIEAAKAVTVAVVAGVAGFYAASSRSGDGGGGEPAPCPEIEESQVVQTVQAALGDDEITEANIAQRLRPFTEAKRKLDGYREFFLFDLFLLELKVQDRPFQPRLLEGVDREYNRRIQTALDAINELPAGATVDDDPQRTHDRLIAFQRRYNDRLNVESDTALSCVKVDGRYPARYLCPEGYFGARTVGAVRDDYRRQQQ